MRKLSSSAPSLADAVAGLPGDVSDPYLKTLTISVELLHRCRRLSLESELAAVIEAGGVPARNAQIMMMHYGFDGKGGRTLADVGLEFGVTRERIRQIVAKIMKRLPKRSYLPILDRALRLIPKYLPAPESFLIEKLRASKITQLDFNIDGVINAAGCFGRGIGIEDWGGGLFGTEKQKEVARALLSEARATSAHDGAASVPRVLAAARQGVEAGTITEVQAAAILSADRDVVWLEEKSWFFVRAPRNRLFNYLRKMLTVSPNMEVAEIRAGISRNHRIDVAPPKRIILEFCRQYDGKFAVDGTRVRLTEPTSESGVLSEVEQKFVKIFRENGVMARDALEGEAQRAGINRHTFDIYIGHNPIIERLAIGVYSLRGATVDPGVVEELRRHMALKYSEVLQDYGWLGPGKIWLGYCISAGLMRGVYSIPAALSSFLIGEFSFADETGTLKWTIKNSSSTGWNLAKYLEYEGAAVGDFLILTFDLAARTGTAYIGTKELLLEFSEPTVLSPQEPKNYEHTDFAATH